MRKLLSFVFLFLALKSGYNQIIKGYVYDINENNEKSPLVGVNVYWLNTQIGTTTNQNGYFELRKPEDLVKSKLIVSYIGYKPDTIDIQSETTELEIVLRVSRELNEVMVIGVTPSKIISESDIKPTEILTVKELQKAACCNLAESFTTNAAVDVQFQDAVVGVRQIQLLGLAGTYTQIMFENIPTQKGIGNAFGLNYVPGPWLSSISVSKGAASVINGSESITGQINFEYKKPEDSERFYFNAFQSSHFRTDFNVNSAINLSDKLSTVFFAHTDFTSKSIDNNNDTFKDQPDVKQFNFFNRWKYHSNNGFELQFGTQYLNEERRGGQITRNQSNYNPNDLYQININTKRLELFTKTGYVFDDDSYKSIGLILNGQYHKQNSLFGIRKYDALQKSFYAKLIFQISDEDETNTLKSGLSFSYDRYDEKFNGIDFNKAESKPGLFVEYKYSPSNLLTLVPGIRLDFHNLYGTLVAPRIHIKINPHFNTAIRLSAGKGFRSVNLFADNINYLASSRKFEIFNQPTFEEAWNYGLSITQYVSISKKELRLTFDYFRTTFLKQSVIDIDTDTRKVLVYDLSGKSYSNNYQFELYYELLSRLEITAAIKYSDVRTQYLTAFLTKPLVSRYKALFTLTYSTVERDWQFDSSFLLNGPGRIPNTSSNPVQYRLKESFSPFWNINGQITKRFDYIDVYFGVENLTDFKQPDAIIAYDDPFGDYFDASMIWGPVEGRKFYAGIRLNL